MIFSYNFEIKLSVLSEGIYVIQVTKQIIDNKQDNNKIDNKQDG